MSNVDLAPSPESGVTIALEEVAAALPVEEGSRIVADTPFSAVTINLDDGHTYVSFRGTDSTITGWREDFTMSFEVMPAQISVVAYLRQRLAESTGPVLVGGHSKGGNLALILR